MKTTPDRTCVAVKMAEPGRDQPASRVLSMVLAIALFLSFPAQAQDPVRTQAPPPTAVALFQVKGMIIK